LIVLFKKILILFFVLFFVSNAFAWADTDYSYRQEWTLDTSGIGLSGNITNDHAILFYIGPSNTDFWANVDSNANDVRFYASDNTTTLDFHFEEFNYADNKAWAWVEITDTFTNTSDVTGYMYYGNATATHAGNKADSYPSTYYAVWNFAETSGTTSGDSTTNNINLTGANDPTRGVVGKIGYGIHFNSANLEYVYNDTFFDGWADPNFSFVAWGKRHSISDSDTIISVGDPVGTPSSHYLKWVARIEQEGYGYHGIIKDVSTQALSQDDDATWDINTWYHFAWGLDTSGNSYSLYRDGVSVATDTTNINQPSFAGSFSIGNDARFETDNSRAWDGYIDEVKILDYKVSDDEVKLLYNSESDNLVSFGAEEEGKGVIADFNYTINKTEEQIELEDTSTGFSVTIDDWDWFVNGVKVSDAQDYNYSTTQLQDLNVCLFVEDSTDTYNDIHCEQFNTGDWEAPITTLSASQVEGTTITTLTFTCNDNNTGCTKTHYNINNEGWLNVANTGTADVNYDGTGANTILYFSEDDNDNNESQNSGNFSTYGYLILNFYEDTFDTSLDEVYLEFDGNAYDSDTNTFITINLEGITSGEKNILIQKTGYQEKNFYLNLNQYSAETYDIGFILSTRAINIEFKVYTETGATKPNTKFFAYDNNYLIDVQTTDSTGTMSMYLNNTKTDYNVISTDLNFSTTTWTLKKPKDALTLDEITKDWSYSITGNAFASQTNIAGDTTKILLQNTATPYYIKIQDVNKAYYLASFGLKSITSEKNKTLNSYLYPIGSADLVLIKLLDFSTNQPISDFKELTLSLYTDTNGLIEIGSYINDSTGTYNIYMNSNSQYQLIIEEQTFILNPTLTIYYLYLTSPSGLDTTNDVNLFTTPYVDLNSPIIMSQVREYFFGCSAEEENCYPSIIFSLIFLVVLAIGFSVYLTVGSLEQSILILVLLGMFTFTGFIPLWLFAISAVITVLWAVFS
jgi:hypothetical protein